VGSRLHAVRLRLRSLPPRTRRQKHDLLASAPLGEAERALLRGVDSRISHRDGMYLGDGRHYFGAGLSALRCVEAALEAAGAARVERILDLPCGHGRVLRFLVRRVPGARVTACDLDRDGVDFCAARFGARPAYSVPDFDRLELDGPFDLAWCGSLVTHLDAAPIAALLRFFARHLAPGGVVVFTAHGERGAEEIGASGYGLLPEAARGALASYRAGGFGYADYPGQAGYGISLTSRDWVRAEVERAGLREAFFRAAGWDAHQDVYGLTRADAGAAPARAAR
jgi:SAM-dependent methyltransferase